MLDDDDEGIAEAIRRDREMDENPAMIMTREEFHEKIAERFPNIHR